MRGFATAELVEDTNTAAILYAEGHAGLSGVDAAIVTIGVVVLIAALTFLGTAIAVRMQKEAGWEGNLIIGFILLFISTVMIVSTVYDFYTGIEYARESYENFMIGYNNQYGAYAMSEDYIRDLGERILGMM